MTDANTPESPRTARRRMWWFLTIFLGVVVGGFFLVDGVRTNREFDRGTRLPRYVYTDTRTELVFDGERIVIEGRAECRRRSWTFSDGSTFNRGPYYGCQPKWFSHRPASGGVLLVGSYAVDDRWPPGSGVPDLTQNREYLAENPRSVLWLDDPVNPTRGEYYFSPHHFRQPGARLTSIETKIVSIDDRTYLRRSHSEPFDQVPWLKGDHEPRLLLGYFAILVPKEVWSVAPGLEARLAGYSEPAHIDGIRQLTREQWRKLLQTGAFTSPHISQSMDSIILDLRRSADPGRGYPRAALVVSLAGGEDGTYRLDRDRPRAVISLEAKPFQKSVTVHFEGKDRHMSADDVPSQLIYFPDSEEIAGIGVLTFQIRR